jgi:hypothetical protein
VKRCEIVESLSLFVVGIRLALMVREEHQDMNTVIRLCSQFLQQMRIYKL